MARSLGTIREVRYTVERLKRMRIAVDAHAVGRKQTGNETYIRNLLREFALAGDEQIKAYISAPSAELYIPAGIETGRVSDNPFFRLGFDLSNSIRRNRPDLLHVQYTSPLNCPVPIVTTVHDVSYLTHPQYFSIFRSTQLRITVKRTIQRAAKIIAPSDFSRQQIIAAYKVPPEKVEVIHNGVDPMFRPIAREIAGRWVMEKFKVAAPYILTVGDLQVRKNQAGLIRAFAALLSAKPELPHHLVLAGKKNWHGSEVMESARRSGISDRIHFTGFVEDEDLRNLYCGCDLFVFPSFYEGFGLPILEAMACGRAVACSNTSAMPEVADSAALLFDPTSVPEMAKTMFDLLVDAELRGRMERLGHARASRFSWHRAATETLAVYERVAGMKKHWKVAQVGA